MAVVPDTRIGKLEFYETHTAPWTTNAAAIGLLPASVTALANATTAARTAYNAAIAAQTAAKLATRNFYDKVYAMHNAPGAGADMIKTIKAYAESKNDPNVYVLAQVPPPAAPEPAPAPGTPNKFKVQLLQNGGVFLTWKCVNPKKASGTIYEIRRQIGTGNFVPVGYVGERLYTDESIPVGTATATYEVTAVRSTVRGNPATFTVRFSAATGSGVGGEAAPEIKIAA